MLHLAHASLSGSPRHGCMDWPCCPYPRLMCHAGCCAAAGAHRQAGPLLPAQDTAGVRAGAPACRPHRRRLCAAQQVGAAGGTRAALPLVEPLGASGCACMHACMSGVRLHVHVHVGLRVQARMSGAWAMQGVYCRNVRTTDLILGSPAPPQMPGLACASTQTCLPLACTACCLTKLACSAIALP